MRALPIAFALVLTQFYAWLPADLVPVRAVSPSLACQQPAPATPDPSASASPLPATPAAKDEPILTLVADLPLSGSPARFDYQSLDPTTGRLYIAHMGADELVVVDTTRQEVVGTVADLPSITGVLAVPRLGRVFAALPGDHQVAVIDTSTLKVVARTGAIDFPDGLDYAPQSGQVFVSDETGGGELVIDATTNQAVTTIDIGGEAGNTHLDAVSGCVLVAVQSRNQLVAIDPMTDTLVARFDLDARCAGPHGFVIDSPARRAFVSCEDNAQLLVLNLATMDTLAVMPVGKGPDVLALDSGLHRVYVASESGMVSLFDEAGDSVTAVGDITLPHAHTVAVDQATHLVYLPLEDVDGHSIIRIMRPAQSR